ncbi:TPA: DUF551 domain-containing protein [Raoultella planticola]
MTKSTITRERLEWLSQISGRDDIEDVDGGEIRELARAQLAAMDSETVADDGIYRPGDAVGVFNVGCETCPDHLVAWTVKGQNLPAGNYWLYISQQPAPVVQMVPEEPPEHLMPKGNTVDATYRRGAAIQAWKQCRAAMLQAGNSPAHSGLCPEQGSAPPAQDGCSPAQNQGWIPVGERMPGSQEWVIVFAKWANQQVLCWDDVQNRWTDFEDQSYYADMFSHWMPLPAAPQEVKGE